MLLRSGFEKLAPYLSIGYSSAFTIDGFGHFFAELGLMYQGQLFTKSMSMDGFTQVPELLNYLEEEGKGLMKIYLKSQSGGPSFFLLQFSPKIFILLRDLRFK